jgi:hypothetical protein
MAVGLSRKMSALALGLGLIGAMARAEDDAPSPSRAPRRFSLGIEGIVSVATDDSGYFNYSSYEKSVTEMIRLRMDASLRLGPRAVILAEGRLDNGGGPSLSAAYLRVRPLADHALDIQVGRIPPVFGAFGRRAYGVDNPLIGQPFIYQYLTSLRSDSLPASADDLVDMKGQGWANYYPIGSEAWDRGVPMVAADRWDTGVEVRWEAERVSAAIGLTQGSQCNPRVSDDNSGKQLVGRLEVRPVLGLVVGASAAQGDYVADSAIAALPPESRQASHVQQAFGADAEFSHGHWLLRAEGILSRWFVPPVEEPFVPSPLEAWGVFVEARRKLRPGLYAAARFDHVGFSTLTASPAEGSQTPVVTTWEAPVTRLEVGAGFNVRRNLVLKAAVQQNWRKEVAEQSDMVIAAQTQLWF